MRGFVWTTGLVTGVVGSLVTAGLSTMTGARMTTIAFRSFAALAFFAALGLIAAEMIVLSGGGDGEEKKAARAPKLDYVIPPELPANFTAPGGLVDPATRWRGGAGGPEEIGPSRPVG